MAVAITMMSESNWNVFSSSKICRSCFASAPMSKADLGTEITIDATRSQVRLRFTRNEPYNLGQM